MENAAPQSPRKRVSFTDAFISVFSMWVYKDPVQSRGDRPASVEDAMRRDWQTVGNDLRTAQDKFGKENGLSK